MSQPRRTPLSLLQRVCTPAAPLTQLHVSQVERITDAALRADFAGEIAAVVEMYRLRSNEVRRRSA